MTEQDRALLLLGNRKSLIRVDLLDSDFEVIEELSGHVISLSLTISATSDIRRVCNMQMHVENKADLSSTSQRIWYNNLIQIHHGINDGNTTHWFLLGSFLLNENSYTYNATTQELSMDLVDMMAAATEIRGSQIGGGGVKIEAGQNIRSAFIATVSEFSPFSRFDVVEFEDTIPYDLEFQATDYPYAVLKKMLELFPLYQMFYTVDGTFTVAPIPDGIDDPVAIPAEVMDELIISEKRTNSAKDVKNTTELFGREINADYTAVEVETVGDSYHLTISDEFKVLEAGSTISFTPTTASITGQKIKVQDLPEYEVYEVQIGGGEVPIAAGAMEADVHYVVRYANSKFYLQGESAIRVIVQEVSVQPTPQQIEDFKTATACRNVRFIVNPESPFAADKIGALKQVLKDGEYAGINTNSLAFERALFENYKKARLTDTLEIESLFVPTLDVNTKIQYRDLTGFPYEESATFSISEDGYLHTNRATLIQYLESNIVGGELVITEKDGFDKSIVRSLEFNMESQELIADFNISLNTMLVQEISIDFANYTMTVSGARFYPYYPF